MKKYNLPSIWQWKTLDNIAEKIVDGPFGSNLKTSDYVLEGIPVLQGKNITNNQFHWFDIRFITEKKAGELQRSKVYQGDHLMIKIGSIGYSAILEDLNGYPFAVIPANMAKITPIRQLVDDRYLYRWLTSDTVKKHLEEVSSQTAQPAISLKKIKETPIPVPPLEEQKRIAAILDMADALHAKRRAALAKLDTLLQATFLYLFGDPITNPMGWPVKSLGNLMTIRRGASPRPIAHFLNGSIPWIKIGDATQSNNIYIEHTTEKVTKEGAEKSVYLKPGALIVANSGVSLGFARILKIDGCIHDGWLALENIDENINKIFLLKLINYLTLYFRQMAPSGTQPNLNTTLMKNFEIPIPPFSLQEKFEHIVNQTEIEISHQQLAMNQLDNLFYALQGRAFRGEL